MNEKNEIIVANKVLSKNSEYFGRLTEKALDGLTEFSTFFSKNDFNSYIYEQLSRTKNKSVINSLSGFDKDKVFKKVAKRLTKEVLDDNNVCAKAKRGNQEKYTTIELVSAEKEIAELSLKMAKKGEEWFKGDKDKIKLINKVYAQENVARGWAPVEAIMENMDYVLSKGNLKVFDGPPGTGKSCLGEALLIGALIDKKKKKDLPRLVVSAPTDKATGAFRAETQVTSDYMKEYNGNHIEVESFTLKNLVKEMNKGGFDDKTFILVDEAGLIGTKDTKKIIKSAQKAGLKLFLLGDTRQISPQTAGNGFDLITRTLRDDKEVKTVTLDRVMRQKIQEDCVATKDLWHRRTEKALKNYNDKLYKDKSKGMTFVEDGDKVFETVCDEYVKHFSKNPKDDDVIAITETNEEAEKLNGMVISKLKEKGVLKNTQKLSTKDGIIKKSEGESVLFDQRVETISGDKKHISAGTAGFISKIEKGKVYFDLENDKKAVISEKNASAAKTAYALSTYAGQGVGKDRVFLAISGKTKFDLTNGMVAFTRHKKQINVFVSSKAYKSYKDLAKSMRKINRNELVRDYEDLKKIDTPKTKSVASLVANKLSRI